MTRAHTRSPGVSAACTIDVLVVGGGPAGSATALRLARSGVRVVLVDRAVFPRDKACAEYMSPETLRQLHLLGVLEAVDAAGGMPLDGTTVIGPRGARMTGLFAKAGGTPHRPTGLSLPRRDLDLLLLDAARRAGVEVREGERIDEFLDSARGAVLRGAHGGRRTVRARLIVGADGLRSVVARRLLGGVHYGWPARVAFVAHLGEVQELTRVAELHVGPQGYVGINPLGEGLANVALVVSAASARSAKGRAETFFRDLLQTFPGVRERVAALRMRGPLLVTGPFAARSRRVVTDGALLVGDAAEFFDPFTGEGICTALRGAAFAAEVAESALAESGTVTAARLAPYLAARRKAFRGKWAIERLIGWGMASPALFDRAVARIEGRGDAHTVIGVTGDFLPSTRVLNPRFMAGLLW